MKVVVAPDSFGGTLSAVEAAAAIAAGWRSARPDDEIVARPMSDGGEGLIDVVAAARPDAARHTVEVADALGAARDAVWLEVPGHDGAAVAVVEAAAAIGLADVDDADRDPMRLTSYGVGMLVADAARADVALVTLGLGGSATVDGGAGALTALGWRLVRADGNGVKVGPASLDQLDRVAAAPPLPAPVRVAVDVTNPLLGADGAARVFAPQKGASPDDVERLEELLGHLADVVERDVTGGPWRDEPGAGAAGGLGFAFAAAGATLVGGAREVDRLVALRPALDGADVVVTGEGSLDAQSARGKVPSYVRELAVEAGARCVALVGRVEPGAGDDFDLVMDLGPEGPTRARELLSQRAAAAAEATAA